MSHVTAAFITPECRTNRGDGGAWEEAVARLREHYDAIIIGWEGAPVQPTINLILDMERPRRPQMSDDTDDDTCGLSCDHALTRWEVVDGLAVVTCNMCGAEIMEDVPND
jgi:hypothetical protein